MIGILIFALIGHSYSLTSQRWTLGPYVPMALTEAAGAVLDGKVYIVGGFDETSKRLNVVELDDLIK